MSEIEMNRMAAAEFGWGTCIDHWFAWRPVKLGPLSEGRVAWLQTVWRCTTNSPFGRSVFYRDLNDPALK